MTTEPQTIEDLAAALGACERRFAMLFQNANIGIFQMNDNAEWITANRTIALILGYETATNILEAQPDKNGQLFCNPNVRSEWLDKVRSDSRYVCEAEVFAKDGHKVWLSLSGHVWFDESGELTFNCTMYDITERKLAEISTARARDEADFANRSKTEFLANMSHELRTPLNAIIGFSEIIKDQMFGAAGNPQYVDYAKDIYDSGQLLLSLINDILDMSKIEAGKRLLQEAKLNLDVLAQSVVRLVAARAKESRIRLSTHIASNLPLLLGEEKALKQILTNLLSNAVKFTPEGGSVNLSAMTDDRNRMLISVIDTGIGIAPQDIATALTPFGQIESAMSRKHQGTGLGLPLTKALVELHGGILDITSTVGIGTTVTLTFPANRTITPS